MLYANTTALPALLQSLFGYDATTSGLVLSPAGVFAIIDAFHRRQLLSRGVDARYLMAAGLLVMGVGNFWMSRMNLDISPWHVVWPRVVVIAGLSMIFAPLNVAAFLYIPKELRGAAVGLLALLRNEGGSVGTSVAQTIHDRREQFHTLRLGENLDPLNPAVNYFLAQVAVRIPPADRRSGRREANGPAISRQSARSNKLRARLLRHLLHLRRARLRACRSRVHDETLCRRQGRAHQRRVS